jgi:hypothetical protein
MPKSAFHIISLIWFFGWGFFLLKFPVQCYRLLSWGRTPTAKHLKIAKIVGYMGVFFGCMLALEMAFGLL